MPRLWSETIEAHRQAVRDGAVDVAAALITERGLRAVTMSAIAERTGIGRATLYKYFPDVGAILRAWHDREIGRHLELVAAARDRAAGPGERLRAVLETLANIGQRSHRHHDNDLVVMLHHDEQVARAGTQLDRLLRDLLTEAAAAGVVRSDVPPKELAAYCRNALAAAGELPSAAAVPRLVEITLAGLRPASRAGH